MFYGQFVLSKKGPLSKIWLAAHWERKLSRHKFSRRTSGCGRGDTQTEGCVTWRTAFSINPRLLQVKLSLRTTGHFCCSGWCASIRARPSMCSTTATKRSSKSRWRSGQEQRRKLNSASESETRSRYPRGAARLLRGTARLPGPRDSGWGQWLALETTRRTRVVSTR